MTDTSIQTAIQYECVSKSFVNGTRGIVHALRDVNITCPTGKITCILGPSGCGKTTLLRLTAGLDSATSGGVIVHGQKVSGPASGLGMVSQEGDLLPWRRVLANIALGLELGGMPAATRNDRALDIMQQVGLSIDIADCYPHELSGGMRQRVALARALCPQPDILLMDEPLSSLDEPTRHDLQQLLWTICRDTGLTLLFVTHNIEEAVFLADHLILMKRGGAITTLQTEASEVPRDRMSESFGRKILDIRRQLADDSSKSITEL